MRSKFLCALALLSSSAAAFSQATGPTIWDVFVGGSYNRLTNTNPAENLYGWDASISQRPYNTLPWLGGTITGGGAYHNTSTTSAGVSLKTTYNIYTFMAGPLVAVPSGRFRPFAHVLLGTAFQHATATSGSTSASASSTNFAFAAGGGADVSINRIWGIRAQADWLQASQTGASALHFVKASAGVVARF